MAVFAGGLGGARIRAVSGLNFGHDVKKEGEKWEKRKKKRKGKKKKKKKGGEKKKNKQVPPAISDGRVRIVFSNFLVFSREFAIFLLSESSEIFCFRKKQKQTTIHLRIKIQNVLLIV